SRRRHTRFSRDWSSDVCSSDLRRFRVAGHKPYALVGGATGMIGDPSGKSAERNLLDIETIERNCAGIRKQLEKFLYFDPSLPNRSEERRVGKEWLSRYRP